MAFNTLYFFALLSVAFVTSHAAQSSEDYWRSVLPNTPMPGSIRELLRSPTEWMDDKSTAVDVGEGNVGVVTSNSGGTGTNVQVRKGSGVKVRTGAPGKETYDGVAKAGIVVRSDNRGTPVYIGINPGLSPFSYNYAASAAQLHDDPNVALFFLEKDLHQGTYMNLHFTKSSTPTHFLPRDVSDSIPFSSNKLIEILNRFSVEQNTLESEIIKNTLIECEMPSINGEEKYCATSLENMIDFTTAKLGEKVNAVSTVVEKENEMQEFRILASKKLGEMAVICHKQNYPYAVFYCHKTNNVKAYAISLVGNDGTRAKAAAICHTDTSSWNPKHLAFQVLKIKPGSVPVCHFLPEDHVVWVPY